MVISAPRVTIALLVVMMKRLAPWVPTTSTKASPINSLACLAKSIGTVTCPARLVARNVVQLRTPMVEPPLANVWVRIAILSKVQVPACAQSVSNQRTTYLIWIRQKIAKKLSLTFALQTSRPQSLVSAWTLINRLPSATNNVQALVAR